MITNLAAAYRDGSRSPTGEVGAALVAIAADEPRLNAVATLLGEQATAAAAQAERELRAGHDRGPLHGVPVGVKDLFAIAGVTTTFGADPMFHERPTRDAAVVARLRAAGAVIVASTQLLEFAAGAVNPLVGQTNNPRDPSRTAGGSSGGSAALVAAGHVPIAVGTDTGGSIRIPAAYCGVVGFKPSFGAIDLAGALPLSWTLDHAGPIAADVADARLLFAALAGAVEPPRPVPLRGLRVGVIAAHRDAACIAVDARAAFEAGVERLRQAGALVSDVDLADLGHVSSALVQIILPEAYVIHAKRLARGADRMAPSTRLQFDAGATIPAAAYLRAHQFRRRFIAAMAAAFERVDVLVSPSAPFAAPAEDPPMEQGGGSGEMLCSAPANLAGLPAISLPCGVSEAGLPFGLHLTGAAGQDARLLDIAAAVEAALV